MASNFPVPVNTPTPNLRVMLQPSNRNRGEWGDLLNGVLMKLDEVFGMTSLTVTGGVYQLQQENFDLDESTPQVIELSGALVAPAEIVFPISRRMYFVKNKTTGPFSVTVTTGSGTPRIIPQGGTTGLSFRDNQIEIATPPTSPDGVALGTSQFADINVTGNLNAGSGSIVGSFSIGANLVVGGSATFGDMNGVNLTLTGALAANGANIAGNTTTDNLSATNLLVTADTTLQGDLTVSDTSTLGDVIMTGSGTVAGDFTISGTLNVAALAIANLSVNNFTVTGLATVAAADVTTLNMAGVLTLASDPVNAMEAATKQYVDALASGIQWKASVRVATTANIALTGTQTIDGVGVVASDRVLVKNQTNPVENGIYVVSAGAWTRSTDADTDAEINGMVCFVTSGTTNGGFTYIIATSPATIAGPKTYVVFSSSVANVSWTVRQF